ncbi:hypothetical protein KR032_011483 [Drosophila birchii]|nr:hypothetical protein KR032_011483 [Drosophila birchii]
MCDISEYALDRQFATQVRALGEVYEENISCQDFDLSQHWLQVFQEVKPKAKFSRNGLMLLLISQLREMGRLGKPFVDIKNMCRPLDDVLNGYDGKMDGELESDALETDTNASTSGSCSSRGSSEVVINDRQTKEANRKLFNLETEKLYASRYHKLEKEVSKKPPAGKQELYLHDRIWQASIRAIDRLKDWTGGTQKIDFLATCFEPFLENEPAISGHIHELDRRLEAMMDDMVKQATDRRHNNMRVLYSCVFQHQKNCCKIRLNELEKSEKLLKEEKQKLRAYAEDLKRREDLLQRHEDIAVQVVKCPDPEKLLLLSPRTPGCENCQKERVAAKSRTCRIRRRASRSRCVQEQGKLSDGPSDLPNIRQL